MGRTRKAGLWQESSEDYAELKTHMNAVKDVRRKGRWQWAVQGVPDVRGLSVQNSHLRSVTMMCRQVAAERRDAEAKAGFSRRKEGTRRKGMENRCEDSYG